MRNFDGGRPAVGLILIALSVLTACDSANPPSLLAPLKTSDALQPAAPRVSGPIPPDRNRLPVIESRGTTTRPPTVSASQPAVGETQSGDITLNFVDTDIREIVRVVLGTTLGLTYTIDPGVQGTATLEVGRPLARSALLPTLETLLNQNGATLTARNGVYRVTPLANGTVTNIVTGPGAVGSGTGVVILRYAQANDLAKVLEPYVAEGGKIVPDVGRNALIVSGDPAVRQTLLGLIEAFDIDVLAGQSYALFPAGDGTPEKLAAEFDKVFRSGGEGPLAGVVRVVPMQRVNAVLVISAQPRYIAEARRLFALERRVEDQTARSWQVYYVQNGQSSDLESLLQRAFTPGHVSASSGPPGATAPGTEALSMNARSGRSSALGTSSSIGAGAGTTGTSTDTTATTPNASTTPRENTAPGADILGGPIDSATGAGVENRIRIIANRRNNALMIYATPSEFSVIQGMLRKIDIIPLQVLIEATIAEVTLNDQLSYGTQFFLGHKLAGILTGGSPISNAGTVATTTGAAGTTAGAVGTAAGAVGTIAGQQIGFANNFPGFVVANGVREVINALSAVTQVKVLSAPQVMVLDNEPARLQVGALVPILTQSQQSTAAANAPIVNSIDYRDTGVIMLVTPRVNSGGLVTLDVSQEVSDVAQATTGSIDSPTFNQRLIRTRVAVQDGQTVGMAGLIRDSDTQGNSGIPFLKDVPLLGTLFSSQQNSRQRTELLVLITPHVVHDQRDARALTEDLRNQLINAGLVPQQLQQRRPSGLANPNGL